MPLDWLFGSKKKAEQEINLPVEDKPPASGDEFVFLDSDQPGLAASGSAGVYPQLPYAIAPKPGNSPGSSKPTVTNVIQQEVTPALGFLSGVPFKLTTADTFQDIDSATAHHMRASQFITYVSENITSDRFSYDFQVEKSVLHEAGCRDLG